MIPPLEVALLALYDGVSRVKASGVLLLTGHRKGRFLTVLTDKKGDWPGSPAGSLISRREK